MKLEKDRKTMGRKKNSASETEVKTAALPIAEAKSKTNGTTEKPKNTTMKSASSQAPVTAASALTSTKLSAPAPQPVKPAAPASVVSKPVAAAQPAKASAPAISDMKPIAKASRSATIEAKIDVGFGNTLYLRGEGIKGVDWDHGVPLKCVDGSTWQWSGEAADEKLKFKLLLNDKVWAKGEDVVATPGQKVQITPSF